MKWTKPYYGVSHISTGKMFPIITVCDYGDFALLQVTVKPDMGFSENIYDSVDEAKSAGEQRLKLLFGVV